jgi:hypothetical protein
MEQERETSNAQTKILQNLNIAKKMKKLDNINSLNKKNEAFYDRLSNVKGFITPTKSMVKKYHT